MGLKLADQIGEDNLELYMCLDSKLMKVRKDVSVHGECGISTHHTHIHTCTYACTHTHTHYSAAVSCLSSSRSVASAAFAATASAVVAVAVSSNPTSLKMTTVRGETK